ncbi:MAG TPA: ribosome maturation factor RimM [bacterium]|nr:ribosome maturation factor RimM [bacterium]
MPGNFGGRWPREGWLIVAELGRPHGIRGEVMIRLGGVEPEELAELRGLRLLRPDGREMAVRVRRLRPKPPGWILDLREIADRGEAEAWRGSLVIAARDTLPEAEEGEWYDADLVGLDVVTDRGETLGRLEEVMHLPANDVFVVRGAREILLPVTDEVVRGVDREAGRVTVHLLPGLVEEE